jgi:hypothetical protein
MDDATKTCLKGTNLTQCQRITAWCGPEKKCIMDAFMGKLAGFKPDGKGKGLDEKVVSNYCDLIEKSYLFYHKLISK